MNSEELELFKEKLDAVFEQMLLDGQDIRSFLYFPHNCLSQRIKDYLDEFLINETYQYIADNKLTAKSFVAYQDSLVTITLDKKDQQKELLSKMIKYFSDNEEYEKCATIQKIFNELQDEQ